MELNAVYCQYRSHEEFQHSEPPTKPPTKNVYANDIVQQLLQLNKEKQQHLHKIKKAIMSYNISKIKAYSKLIFGFAAPVELKDILINILDTIKRAYESFKTQHSSMIVSIIQLNKEEQEIISGLQKYDEKSYEEKIDKLNKIDNKMQEFYKDNKDNIDFYNFMCDNLFDIYNLTSTKLKKSELEKSQAVLLDEIKDFLLKEEIIVGSEKDSGIENEKIINSVFNEWLKENRNLILSGKTKIVLSPDCILYINRFQQNADYLRYVFGKFKNTYMSVVEPQEYYIENVGDKNSMCIEKDGFFHDFPYKAKNSNNIPFVPMVIKHTIDNEKKRYYICDMKANCFYAYTKITIQKGIISDTYEYIDSNREFTFDITNNTNDMKLSEVKNTKSNKK